MRTIRNIRSAQRLRPVQSSPLTHRNPFPPLSSSPNTALSRFVLSTTASTGLRTLLYRKIIGSFLFAHDIFSDRLEKQFPTFKEMHNEKYFFFYKIENQIYINMHLKKKTHTHTDFLLYLHYHWHSRPLYLKKKDSQFFLTIINYHYYILIT